MIKRKEIYLNYIFKDGGFKKRYTQLDKYVFLLNNLDTPEKEKIFYKPKKISVITEPLVTYTILYRYYFHVLSEYLYSHSNNKKVHKHLNSIYLVSEGPENKKIVYFNNQIKDFLEEYRKILPMLNEKDKHYKEIPIPKKKKVNGKTQYRILHEPAEEIKKVQTLAKEIIEDVLKIHPHDAVHSYTKKRDNTTNAKMHTYSKHIINIDLKDYFGSINEEILYRELSKFKELCLYNMELSSTPYFDEGKTIKRFINLKALTKELLDAIINVATYKNRLPQGSPLSPTLSNLVFFKVDHELQEYFNTQPPLSKTRIMYTRYCDDLTFSSFNPINLEKLKLFIILALEDTPFKINEEKTKYLKNTHRCYITGVKINKDNKATYGHEKKAQLKRDIFQLFMLYKEGNNDKQYASEVLGQLAYLQKLEPAYAKTIIQKYCKQFKIRPKLFYKYFLG